MTQVKELRLRDVRSFAQVTQLVRQDSDHGIPEPVTLATLLSDAAPAASYKLKRCLCSEGAIPWDPGKWAVGRFWL